MKEYTVEVIKGGISNVIYKDIADDVNVSYVELPAMDKFGIPMIYPTAVGGKEYFINMNATTVVELQDGGKVSRLPTGLTRNSDGSWRVPKSQSPRWVITGGWKNVEITARMRLIDAGLGSYLQMYCRGEEHTNTITGAWHGSANKARLRFDGAVGFIKELYHENRYSNSGYTSAQGYTSSGIGDITNKWVTWKFICYNLPNGNPKLEIYVFVNGKFELIREYEDTGDWYASTRFDQFMNYMKANYPSTLPKNRDTLQIMKRNEKITWKGDFVSFRSDDSTYDFKDVSVREISVPSSTPTEPTGNFVNGSGAFRKGSGNFR